MEPIELLKTLTAEDLLFIASRDYGEDVEKHFASLRRVIEAGGLFQEHEYRYPYEVVQLGSHALLPGHEREFVACTLLVIAAVRSGYDTATNLGDQFAERMADYDRLDPALRESVVSAYAWAGL